ncbi:aminotransferase class I/II-fold pyridoxal phosphate-dependent enzyme [Paenibacillus sp. 1011MAR3C5]|uniref:DegT/DnrJ/EryC1/StrS family aminotransferase n=1 Tax=Paenibacillus sp. 1011MAR3C5 TaxID=1675787 RepID=UPI000E6CECD1|nr:aminotransferase class I/II-fold pyridoxal phosphate-dependent enzyme [Paenibacillus sp. 1011MAR3C5]RJE89670.1 aminotransferase class I/II-fold pyridoxal phosphate-dependent enzyme [Paenibacillus sp. 1011MAR3C5]
MNLIPKQPHDIWPPKEMLHLMKEEMIHYFDQHLPISIRDGSGVIAELEQLFKEYYNVDFALAVNSGTSAVHSMFTGIGIKPGDEVITQTTNFHASVTPLLHCGGIPVLCDTDGKTGNICVDDLMRKLTPKTKAVVVTHMWGYPAEMDKVKEITDKYGMILIEDCSHAHGTIYKGKKVGTWGDVAVFSLQGSKLVPAGEGGVLITNHRDIYEKAVLLGQFGERAYKQVQHVQEKIFWETGYGLKYRMHPLAAVCAITAFKSFESFLETRQRRIKLFHSYIKDIPFLHHKIEETENERYSYFMNRILYDPAANNGQPLKEFLNSLISHDKQLDIRKASIKPLHVIDLFTSNNQDFFQDDLTRWRTYSKGDFPITETYIDNLIGVPCFDHPDGDELARAYGQYIAEAVGREKYVRY